MKWKPLLFVTVCALAGGSYCDGGEENLKCGYPLLANSCNQDLNPKAAKRLVKKLVSCGGEYYDDMVMYATSSAPPECRVAAVLAVAQLSKGSPANIKRFYDGLGPLVAEPGFADVLASTCIEFGALANDELIGLLAADDQQMRVIAQECLSDINEKSASQRALPVCDATRTSGADRETCIKAWKAWWVDARSERK